jgi:hypothetical protein
MITQVVSEPKNQVPDVQTKACPLIPFSNNSDVVSLLVEVKFVKALKGPSYQFELAKRKRKIEEEWWMVLKMFTAPST